MERCMEQRYADKKFCNCKIVGFIVISVEKSPEASLFPDFFSTAFICISYIESTF